jgi:hypothetical protein
MKRVITAIALAAVLLVGASAQQQPKPADVTTEDASVHGFGDKDKTCQEWTDGCVTCQRDGTGDPVCPNIGPACQPKAIICVRRTEPAKAEPPKSEPPKTEPPKTEPSK